LPTATPCYLSYSRSSWPSSRGEVFTSTDRKGGGSWLQHQRRLPGVRAGDWARVPAGGRGKRCPPRRPGCAMRARARDRFVAPEGRAAVATGERAAQRRSATRGERRKTRTAPAGAEPWEAGFQFCGSLPPPLAGRIMPRSAPRVRSAAGGLASPVATTVRPSRGGREAGGT
jgi:hypothetical protein